MDITLEQREPVRLRHDQHVHTWGAIQAQIQRELSPALGHIQAAHEVLLTTVHFRPIVVEGDFVGMNS
jgi:hypothetical protein